MEDTCIVKWVRHVPKRFMYACLKITYHSIASSIFETLENTIIVQIVDNELVVKDINYKKKSFITITRKMIDLFLKQYEEEFPLAIAKYKTRRLVDD